MAEKHKKAPLPQRPGKTHSTKPYVKGVAKPPVQKKQQGPAS